MTTRDYRLGLILVTTSAVAWSAAGLFTRAIGLDTWTMLAWRGIFGALAMGALMLALQGRQAWSSILGMKGPGWAFVGVSAMSMALFIHALQRTTVAHVSVIYATVPIVAAIVAWLVMGERPAPSAVVASVVALCGVVVMTGLGSEGHLAGDLLAVAMTLCMAALMVIARHYHDIPTMPAAALSALLSALVCWPLGNPLSVTAHDLLLLSLFGAVNSAVGMALFALGARLLPAIETALIGALDAPLAPLWVWLWFQETPSGATLVGGVIVFVAVAIHLTREALLRRG